MSDPTPERNVLGGELEPCSTDPLTGFFRDGSCRTGPQDVGSHTICAVVSGEFLDHQRRIGNDLSTPMPEYRFPGLDPGDRWCVTAQNWLRAHADGVAAPVVLASTHERATEIVPLEVLREHAVDVPDDPGALDDWGPGRPRCRTSRRVGTLDRATTGANPVTETRYDGRVAIITGAASGMGRAITLRLAAEGAAVLALDIDEAGLAETAADTRAAGRVTTRVTDVSDPEQCRAAVDACVATHGRLDVLGNVAAVAWMAHATDIEPEAWRRMFAVNVEGTFYLCQAAIPHLIETGGNIVNFASNAAFMGMPYLVPYCASKGAVVQLTRALAIEYAKTPMRINAIAPGGTDTPMNTAMELPDAVDFDLIRPGMGYRESGRPEHIAALFAFLAGDEADNIHGAVLNADSGLTTA